MKVFKERDMIRGWFVGNFIPTTFDTKACEASVRRYKAGDFEPLHHHKVATEITAIISGTVKMNGVTYSEGDIIVTEPGDATDFLAETDAVNVVIKVPSVIGDKYLGKP